MKTQTIVTVLILSLALIFASGCAQYVSTSNDIILENNTIVISSFAFNPPNLTVNAGTTVTWKHDDSVTHDIVLQGLFDSGAMVRDDTFKFTFSEPGEYDYYCSIHPSMRGKIIVK